MAEEAAGRKLRCPRCDEIIGATVQVPAPSGPSIQEAQTVASPPAVSPSIGAPPETDPEMKFAKYELIRRLGSGGMGIVYEARDTELDRKVALKTMFSRPLPDPEASRMDEDRFLREGRLSAKLKHPNIVAVYETGVWLGKRYLAMELIDGKPMNEWRKGFVSLRQEISVLRDVALAVQHAHENQIIHRDLKPQNVLIDSQGVPHVSDFGLAKQVDQAGAASLTGTGVVLGTPAYSSPEQAQGLKTIDHRTDVYSLGVMLYETLTGRTPFVAETLMVLLMKVVSEPVAPPSGVKRPGVTQPIDRAIEAICLKALAKKPEDRYPSAKDFAEDLTRWMEGRPITAEALPEDKSPKCPNCMIPIRPGSLICVRCGARVKADDEEARLERRLKLEQEYYASEADEMGKKSLVWALIGFGVPFACLLGAYFGFVSVRRSVSTRTPFSVRGLWGLILSMAQVTVTVIGLYLLFSSVIKFSEFLEGSQ
jgi:serine/threonine protein kinase